LLVTDDNKRVLKACLLPALKEAVIVYRMWLTIKDQLIGDFTQKKPSPYKHIKSNYPIGDVQIYKQPSNVCECKENMDNPCGEQSNCLNRLTLVECQPQVRHKEASKLYSLQPFQLGVPSWREMSEPTLYEEAVSRSELFPH
jgi:hypothetical protein